MPDGVKDILGLDEPKQVDYEAQAAEFKQAFQQRLNQINEALQYTTANADAKGHNAQAAKRDKLITAYQTVVGKFSSSPESAQAAGDKILSTTESTGGEVSQYRDQVQQDKEAWEGQLSGYDDTVAKITQLAEWEDPKAAQLQTIADKIQQQADQNLYKPATEAVGQFSQKLQPIYEAAEKNQQCKEEYEGQLPEVQTQLSQTQEPAGEASAQIKKEIDALKGQMEQAASSNAYDQAKEFLSNIQTKTSEFQAAYSKEVSQQGKETHTDTVGELKGSVKAGLGVDPSTGERIIGAAAEASATAYSKKVEGGSTPGEVKLLHAEGGLGYGSHKDPKTGEEFIGVKASGKGVLLEQQMDTPAGKYEGSIGKAEFESVVGYEYDPEKKVSFTGMQAKAGLSAVEAKLEGKYGKFGIKGISAGVETKTGVEYDEKTGKLFLGTQNKAEASVLEAAGEIKTGDGAAKLAAEGHILKAEASLDANAVVDKYGIDLSGKVGAEASVAKGGIGGEIRVTPKALFDNTIGAVADMEAPDWADFGPVFGAKVSGAVAGAGATFEGGGRLGVDEINARAGGFIELGAGVGLDVKTGVRLGPLKYAYDNWDDIKQSASDAKEWAGEKVDQAEQWKDEKVQQAEDWAQEKSQQLEDWADEKTQQAEDWANEKKQQVETGYETAKDWATDKTQQVQDWAQEKADTAQDWAQDKAEQIETGLDSAKDWATEKAYEVKDWAEEKAKQVEAGYETVKNWASSQASSAQDWVDSQASSTWSSLFD